MKNGAGLNVVNVVVTSCDGMSNVATEASESIVDGRQSDGTSLCRVL